MPDYFEKHLRGRWRKVQPWEPVLDGDMKQERAGYRRVDDAERNYHEAAGGAYGTYWRKEP